MIVKIVFLFLIGIAVLAMFGKLRMPKIGLDRRPACRSCGTPRVGRGPCPCGKDPKA